MPGDGENSLICNDKKIFSKEMPIFVKPEKSHFNLLGHIYSSSLLAKIEKAFPGKA